MAKRKRPGEQTIYVTKYGLTKRGIVAMNAVVTTSGGAWVEQPDGEHGKYYEKTEYSTTMEDARKVVMAKAAKRKRDLDKERVRLGDLVKDIEKRGAVTVDGVTRNCNEASGLIAKRVK